MYMQSVKFLLLLLMSAHGIFGCCWHHVHSRTADGDEGETEVAWQEGHHHGQAHDAHEEDATSSECPGHDEENCDEEACVYVQASKIDSEFQVTFDLAFADVVDFNFDFPTSLAIVFTSPSHSDRLVQTTGERCARLQTWLI